MNSKSTGTDWTAICFGVGLILVAILGVTWSLVVPAPMAEVPMEDYGVVVAVHRFQASLTSNSKTEIVTDRMSLMIFGHPNVPLGKRFYYRAASGWKREEYEWR